MNTIHVAYALNDNFAEMTGVSIRSVLQHCNRDIVFHVFESDLTDDSKSKLQSIVGASPNAELRLYNKELDSRVFLISGFVSKETYTIALLQDLLPDLSRIIWIDGDILFEKNVDEIWDIELGEAYAAMVPDYPMEDLILRKEILGIIGIQRHDTYYNTGVALLDLQKLRAFQFTDKVIDNIERLYDALVGAGLNWYRVQDVMNYLLREKILRLPVKYNSFFWQSTPLCEPLENCVEEILEPVAIHLIASPKPTMLGALPVFSADWERYYYYKRLTPFAKPDDDERIAKYKKREDNTINGLIMDLVKSTRYFAPRLFEAAVDAIKKQAENRRVIIWGLNDLTWNLVAFLAANDIAVESIVDGLPKNQEFKVFDHAVESPDILQADKNDAFVLIDVRSNSVAEQIRLTLLDWNYYDKDFYYVYSPIWE